MVSYICFVQLPGRSDNEIKNFWHKKAKKRHKHHLPIYPNHTNLPNTIINHNYSHNNEANPTDNEYFPNYPNQTLPSQSSELQPSTPNVTKTPRPSNDTSPQTLISTPPPQFISSPASSSYHKQSPTNYVTDQTSTPTSHNTQNLLLSPNPTDQTPLLITNSSNAFTPLRKPPILSSPNGPLRRFSRAASKLSPDSSMQMQSSSAMESPRSPLKLNLSPRIPYTAPISPLKLRLSIPIPSESCFQSNLSIQDSTVQLSSSTEAVPLSSPQMNGLDSPPIQPVSVNTDNIIHIGSSQTIKIEPPSIQVYQPVTPGANSGVHEVEPDNDSEIMEELREAQSRVRLLKKKLRLRRISNKRSLPKGSSETTDLLKTEVPIDGNSSESTTKECLLQTSSRTKNFFDDILRVKAPPKNSRKNIRDDMIGISNDGALQVTSASKENKLSKLQKTENSDLQSGKARWDENPEMKTSLEESLKRNNSMTFQEQMHSIDLFDHLNIQNTVNAPNSDSWDYSKLCPFQDPAGKCLNECSTIESLFSESSTLLQGDLFGQTSGIENPLSQMPLIDHAFGPVYSQSTATTLVKPGDEGGYFGYSFGREISENLERKLTDGLIDGNLAVKSILCETNLLSNHDLLDSSYLVGTPIMEHESSSGGKELFLKTSGGENLTESQLCESSLLLHQYPSADLLESGYLVSKQIIEQESLRGEQFFLQTPGGGHSDETSKLCEATLLLHQSPPANLLDSRYLVGFEDECPQGEQYSFQTSANGFDRDGMKTEHTSIEIWKQEPSREQSLMQGLLIENLWPEGQVVSQDQTFSTDRFHSGVVDLIGSDNWNNESGCGHTGEILKQEQEHDNMNTMPEELSSLLEFFPTNIQTPEWYNIPDTKASNEFDMGHDLQMSSTSQPLLTIADYI